MPNYIIDKLRKTLQLKKLPEPDINKGVFPVYRNNVRLFGLGIREDKDVHFKVAGKTHEGI